MGASSDATRTSHLAVLRLRERGFDVVAFSNKGGRIADVEIITSLEGCSRVDTVTLYLAARHQDAYVETLLALRPRRMIFNPGAENSALLERANSAGIQALEACTLVLLSTGQF